MKKKPKTVENRYKNKRSKNKKSNIGLWLFRSKLVRALLHISTPIFLHFGEIKFLWF